MVRLSRLALAFAIASNRNQPWSVDASNGSYPNQYTYASWLAENAAGTTPSEGQQGLRHHQSNGQHQSQNETDTSDETRTEGESYEMPLGDDIWPPQIEVGTTPGEGQELRHHTSNGRHWSQNETDTSNETITQGDTSEMQPNDDYQTRHKGYSTSDQTSGNYATNADPAYVGYDERHPNRNYTSRNYDTGNGENADSSQSGSSTKMKDRGDTTTGQSTMTYEARRGGKPNAQPDRNNDNSNGDQSNSGNKKKNRGNGNASNTRSDHKKTTNGNSSTAAQQTSGDTTPCDTDDTPCTQDDTARAIEIKSILMQVSDRIDLNDPESPQYEAAAWIIYGDPMRLSPSDPRLFQRYSAAVFYFAMHGDSWTVCSADTSSPCGGPGMNDDDSDDNAGPSSAKGHQASDLNTATDDNTGNMDDAMSGSTQHRVLGSSQYSRWLSNTTECKWYGLSCDSKSYITSIDLIGNNLRGELPPEIKTLCKVHSLKMNRNKISGTLPTELGELSLLKVLRLGVNNLSGTIPSSIYQLTTMKKLDLHDNRLSGSISTKMSKLKLLTRLQLSQNSFTGTLPRKLGKLENLKTLQVQFNNITGRVPSSVCELRYERLVQLEADCGSPPDPPLIRCQKTCCTACFSQNEQPISSLTPTLAPTSNSSSGLMHPTPTPTVAGTLLCGTSADQRAQDILQKLVDVTDIQTFQDTSSPQRKALEFIVNFDDAIICPDSPDLVQRYIIAAFYYGLGGDKWLQCSADKNSECTTPSGSPGVRWLSEGSECTWYGVECDNGDNVLTIQLDDNNLVGTVVSEIGSLQDLSSFDVQKNSVTGPIPAAVFDLMKLEKWNMAENALTGTISPKFGDVSTLVEINLSNNTLAGTIPSTLGNLADLQTLQLQGTDLTGSVPANLCQSQNALKVLAVDCLEVTCPSGCCTCYPLGSGSRIDDNKDASAIGGVTSLANVTDDGVSQEQVQPGVNSNETDGGGGGGANDLMDDFNVGLLSANETAFEPGAGVPEENTTRTSESLADVSNHSIPSDQTESLPSNLGTNESDIQGAVDDYYYYDDNYTVSNETYANYYNTNYTKDIKSQDNYKIHVQENPSGTKNAADIIVASSSGKNVAIATSVTLVSLIILIGGLVFDLLRRRRNSKDGSNNPVTAPPDDAFNLDEIIALPASTKAVDDGVESSKEHLSSCANSSRADKNGSCSSSDHSSKVKDADVIQWWSKIRGR